ncbi:hypothetical protein JCM19235_1956 [Vibrio maritimus]|uniref:Phage protein n=1 Tax=Vibrio maritimus TaxID=990268 RepID=A0A090RVG9_9VIBR|nr:hypothetical protein JCM19235_1956 [Vibrio maritimus]
MDQMITSKAEGFKELEDALYKLSLVGEDKDAFDGMSFAIRKALKPVQEEAKKLAPVGDGEDPGGHLRDRIKISTPRKPNKVLDRRGRAAYGTVSVTGGKGRAKKGDSRTRQKAIAAEFGLSSRAQFQAKPFLRPALYRKQGEVLRILQSELSRFIQRRTKRIVKLRTQR